jgi:hypothetical protein
VTIGWSAGDFEAGFNAVAFVGVHPSIGLQNKRTGMLQVLAAAAPAGTSADVTAVVADRFGDVQAGWKLFAELYRLRDDGVRSSVTSATCEVA